MFQCCSLETVFLPGGPHEQYKRCKDMTAEDEPSSLKGVQYASGEEQRAIPNINSISKNEVAA